MKQRRFRAPKVESVYDGHEDCRSKLALAIIFSAVYDVKKGNRDVDDAHRFLFDPHPMPRRLRQHWFEQASIDEEAFIQKLKRALARNEDGKMFLAGVLGHRKKRTVRGPRGKYVSRVDAKKLREQAYALFAQGIKSKGVAARLTIPEGTASGWLYKWRRIKEAEGKQNLIETDDKKIIETQGGNPQCK